VLAERSLPDALTALAAACPVACRIDADLTERYAVSVEATAYFVVAEALTNIAKHSGARNAAVRLGQRDGQLRVVVVDDGQGGAEPRAGSGLSGDPAPGRSARRDVRADQSRRRTYHYDCEPAMRIVIAEDDFLVREGLALMLRAESLDVVATASSPDDFLAAVGKHHPDVAIVDVRMPPTHTDEGIVAAVEARRRQPGLAVLVLSAYVEQAFATELFADGGSRLGYLLKERVGRG